MRRVARVIIGWEWLILLVLLPLLLFPSGWRSLLLLIIPLLWVIRKVATGRFVPPTAFDVAIFLMITALLISLAAVFDMTLSFPKIAGLILGIAFFYGAVQYAGDYADGEYHLLGLIFVAGTGMGMLALFSNLQTSFLAFSEPVISLLPSPLLSLLDILDAEVNPNEMVGFTLAFYRNCGAWFFPGFGYIAGWRRSNRH